MTCKPGLSHGGPLLAWISLAAGLLAGVPGAHAFVSYANPAGQPQKWNLTHPAAAVHTNIVNPSTRTVRYFLAADAYSSANREAELNAARACFDQWQAVPGSILRFEEGGLMTGAVDVHTADNTNVVFWAKGTLLVNGGLDNIRGTTGVTFSDFYSDSTLAEADIVLNGVEFAWFTDFNDRVHQGQFVESVLLHEIGHLIGLAHSPVGAATMFPRGGPGVSVQAGLSSDEIAAVRALYPAPSLPPLARLSGQVTLGGAGVFGAVVCAEDAAGNLIAGTVTRADGRYDMPALPAGPCQVRVTPIDPANASYFLLRGRDIAPDFATADPNFLPSPASSVTLTAGVPATQNFAVIAGTPPFRIGRFFPPTTDPARLVVVNYPVVLPAAGSEVILGVYSPDLPTHSATLRITGDGLTFGATTAKPNAFPGVNPPLNLLSVPVHIGPGATPGMRSLVVQQGASLAYANGFVEIAPAIADDNFDGLDDRFQREHFPRWTAASAAPLADPDQDGYTNADEYLAGTDPTDRNSVLRVESVRVDASGATVTWPSAPGKRYQVVTRALVLSNRTWQPIGEPVVSTGSRTHILDTNATTSLKFYRVQALAEQTAR